MEVSESVPTESGVAPVGADRSAMTQSTLEAVAAAAFVAGVGAALSGLSPTGTSWWDPVLSAVLAVGFVVAASRANTTVLVGVGGLAAALVGFSPWLVIGIAGFGCAVTAGFRLDRRVEIQAFAGALTITTLLHLQSLGSFGISAAVTGASAVVVWLAGYRRSSPAAKQMVRSALALLALVLLIAFVIGGVIGLSARTAATEGVDAARLGLSSARAGDPQELARQLEVAAERLSDANGRIASPFLKPLYLVPIVSQHLRAVAVASEQGVSVATEARATVVEADLGQLQLRQGQFDLDLLTTMAPRLEQVATQLQTSVARIEQVRSPWLAPPLDDRIGSLVDEVRDVLPEAQIAVEAAQVVPQMLGADGERRYLMLFGSPGESREFGGFVGGYALLSVEDGGLDLIQAGSINELRDLPRPESLADPSSYPTQFVEANPAFFPQNLTSTPNLAVILRAATEIFPNLAGAPIDGLIYADPYALGAFTAFTGPIDVPILDQPLDQAGVADFIFNGQYKLVSREQRFDAMGALAIATAAAFEDVDLPGPERLGEVLGPIARAGRLQVITHDDRENSFLASVLLQRNFVAPASIDAFAVIQTNGSESKLDLFLERDIHYDVLVAEDGSLQATVDVTVRSVVPVDAPALTFGNTDGTNQVLLSLYSPHELTGLTVDGAPHQYVTQQEFGFFRYALFRLPLRPNQEAQIQFELAGSAPTGPYRVGVWAQPMVNPDNVRVTYRGAAAEAVSEQRELVENWVFDASQPAG